MHGTVFETVHEPCSSLSYHRHGVAFATIVLDGGYSEVVRNGDASACRAGLVVMHTAGEEHAEVFAGRTRCLNVELPRDFALQSFSGFDDETMRGPLEALVRSFYEPRRRTSLDEAVADVLDGLARKEGALEQPRPDWLETTLRDFGWTQGRPLRDAARDAGVHPTHFARTFARRLGMTPNAYRRRQRVRHASALLLHSAMPPADIALACGYCDQSHFTNAFTRAVGLSPAAFREAFVH